MHASHEVCDERVLNAGAELVLGGIRSGEAKGRMLDVRALVDVSEQARGNRQEIHRFSGVLIGGEERSWLTSQWRHQRMTPWNAIAQGPTVGTAQAMPRGCGADDAIAGTLTAGCDWVES